MAVLFLFKKFLFQFPFSDVYDFFQGTFFFKAIFHVGFSWFKKHIYICQKKLYSFFHPHLKAMDPPNRLINDIISELLLGQSNEKVEIKRTGKMSYSKKQVFQLL